MLRRFNLIGLAIVSLLVGLGLYTLSLSVAQVRREVDQMDRKIERAREQVRVLQVEFNARAAPAQVEQWNEQMLGLKPPVAQQYSAGASAALRRSEAVADPAR